MARNRRLFNIGVAVALGAIMVIAGGAAMVWHSQDGILVTVKNSDATSITSVEVALGGKLLALGAIEPGETARRYVVPIADSTVTITYLDSAGVERAVNIDTYVTGNYDGRLDAEIQAGKLVSSRVKLGVGLY